MDVVASIARRRRLFAGRRRATAVSKALLEADPNLRTELKRRGFLRVTTREERKKAGLKRPVSGRSSRSASGCGAFKRRPQAVRHDRCSGVAGEFLKRSSPVLARAADRRVKRDDGRPARS